MPWIAGQTGSMSWIRIIQARVLGFEAITGSVEAGGLLTDFGKKIASKVGLEARGIVGLEIAEQMGMKQWRYCWFQHPGAKAQLPGA